MALILIVEDGSALPAANSYASLAEANAYHEAHLHAQIWEAADDATKEKALVMATRVIDTEYAFAGYRTGELQGLEWPRYEVPRYDLAGWSQNPLARRMPAGDYWPETTVPKRIKDATAELARLLMEGDRTADADTKGISAMTLGQGAVAFTFDKTDRTAPLPDHVLRMLEPFGQSREGTSAIVKVSRA